MPKRTKPQLKVKPVSAILVVVSLVIGFFSGKIYQVNQQDKLPVNPTVTRIIDGDNLELDTGESVRLYGINCPEKGKSFAKEAIELTTKLTLNKEIRIEYQPNYTKDTYQRILGFVFINDVHLNEELVKAGFCEVKIYKKRAKLIYQDELLEAEKQAKEQKLGKWQ